ncbi:MAG: EamA family transporter [Ignavibacteria bacterium]|nr:EamA family transporter [Ignavibacteria bacterium]
MKRFKAELLLLLTATIWAGTFPIVKVSMSTLPPFYFIGIRFLVGAILFTAIFFRKVDLTDKGIIKAGIILGFFQIAGFATQTAGMIYTTASNSALITGVTILIVPFAQYALTKKKVQTENWIGVFIVVAGLYLLTQPHINGLNIGDLITLFCAFAWAFYIIYVDIFTNKFDVISLIFIQLWFVVIIAFGIGAVTEDFSAITFNTRNILSFLYMGILATFVTTLLLNKYQKETTPVRASIIYTWEQPAAVMLAILFIHENFNFMQLAGGAIMIAGILYSETYEFIRLRMNKSA